MKLRSVIIAGLITILAIAPTHAQEETDFRDLRWGDPLDKLGTDAREVVRVEGLVTYRKINEDLSLGSLPVTHISYIFFDGRLIGVLIGINDRDTKWAKDVLQAKYGPPLTESRITDDATWLTDRTMVILSDRFNDAYIGLVSRKLDEEYKEWRERQAEKDAAAW